MDSGRAGESGASGKSSVSGVSPGRISASVRRRVTCSTIRRSSSLCRTTSLPGNSRSLGIRRVWLRPFRKSLARRGNSGAVFTLRLGICQAATVERMATRSRIIGEGSSRRNSPASPTGPEWAARSWMTEALESGVSVVRVEARGERVSSSPAAAPGPKGGPRARRGR